MVDNFIVTALLHSYTAIIHSFSEIIREFSLSPPPAVPPPPSVLDSPARWNSFEMKKEFWNETIILTTIMRFPIQIRQRLIRTFSNLVGPRLDFLLPYKIWSRLINIVYRI